MSDHKLDSHQLKIRIMSWRQQYGEPKVSEKGTEYWSIPHTSSPRRPLLEIFFRMLIEQHNYKAEDFDARLCDTLRDACVNPEKIDKKKLRDWKEAVEFDILQVLANIFPNEPVKEVSKTYEGNPPAMDSKKGQEVRKEMRKEEVQKNEPDPDLLDLKSLNLEPLKYDRDINWLKNLVNSNE